MTARRTPAARNPVARLAIAALAAACFAIAAAPATAQANPAADLPDYSYAGYAFGEAAIPDVAGRVFNVTDFGATPNDDAPDRLAIQSAIDAAAAAGGGVVFFPPGRFDIVESDDITQVLRIRTSNIVLRGSGAGPNGTTLFMEHPTALQDPKIKWSNRPAILFQPDIPDPSSRRILEAHGQPETALIADASAGSFTIRVADPTGFKVGDTVALAIESTDINPRFLDGLPTRDLWERINTTGVVVNALHLVTAIDGKELTFHAPLMMDVFVHEGWAVIRREMLLNCGVEDLHIQGNFHEAFVHHKNYVHDNGYRGVAMVACRDSWVQRCRFSDISAGAILTASLACSILDCTMSGNPGHNSFGASFGTRSLIGRCRDDAGTFHGPAASHLAAGTVIWRYQGGDSRGGPDFHATFPLNTLVDVSSAIAIDHHGGNYKDLPNHLGELTYWNYTITADPSAAATSFHFWDLLEDDPARRYGPMTAVRPHIIGLQSPAPMAFPGPMGTTTPVGQAVAPESLYEHQLEQRLGHRPAWLDRASPARTSHATP
ncbi:MAG: DUF4955 domain-containing protein [Planctomycetota bacterium]